jgi:hypothetical protein
MVETPGLVDVLGLLAQGVGAGFVLAFLAEKAAWFQRLPGEKKNLLIMAISLGLPVLAQALLRFVPDHVWTTLQPYWSALAAGFVGWAGSQAAYVGLIKPQQERERTVKLLE